jgi:hypothetical protein
VGEETAQGDRIAGKPVSSQHRAWYVFYFFKLLFCSSLGRLPRGTDAAMATPHLGIFYYVRRYDSARAGRKVYFVLQMG